MMQMGEENPHPFEPDPTRAHGSQSAGQQPAGAPSSDAAPHAAQPATTTHVSASASHPRHTPPPESRTKHLGALLGGSAAFIAALTTAWVNLRDDVKPKTAPAAVAAPAATASPSTTPEPAPLRGPARLRVTIDRIGVDHDGSPGTTDWRFEVTIAGQRVMAFQQNGLDDSPGLNVATPTAAANVSVPREGGVPVEVKGWRLGPLHDNALPDVSGAGKLTADGVIAPMPVQANKADEGAFVFTFHAKDTED